MSDVDRALSLLFQAARVSPVLRDAVVEVEKEVHRLRSALSEHEPDADVAELTWRAAHPEDIGW